jgi:ABC-type multidrug transport system fused ATPase/permease subunit
LALYLHQPYEFFLDRHSGEMSTRILSESAQVINGYLSPVAELIASTLTITALLALLIWVNPTVAFSVFIAFGGTYAAVYLLVRKQLAYLGPIRAAANKERFMASREVLGGIKEVKLHGRELFYLSRFSTASDRMVRTSIVASLIGALPSHMIQSIALGGMVVLCLVLLDPAQMETGTVMRDLLPTIGVIAFSAQRMMPEFGKIYRSLASMKFGTAVVEMVYDDFQKDRSVRLAPGSVSQPRIGLTGKLDLEQISYKYPNASEPNLDNVSLTIRAGERIGIVGSTGAGKTTLADVVLGLLHPTDGRMLADGTEINEGNLRAWQASVAYVPQDIFLMDTSVSENIAFGVPPDQINRVRVETVARIAQLDGFVRDDLPDGYETKVGEKGVRLSGGQRQRIGIARALYHNADLIVFDEATSALDNLTEREVMTAIDALPGDKTVVMIAHRLSTVKGCDRIIVMDKGRIVGIGPWSDLIEHNAAFRKIAEAA